MLCFIFKLLNYQWSFWCFLSPVRKLLSSFNTCCIKPGLIMKKWWYCVSEYKKVCALVSNLKRKVFNRPTMMKWSRHWFIDVHGDDLHWNTMLVSLSWYIRKELYCYISQLNTKCFLEDPKMGKMQKMPSEIGLWFTLLRPLQPDTTQTLHQGASRL